MPQPEANPGSPAALLTPELAAAARIIQALLTVAPEVRLKAMAIVARLLWDDGRIHTIAGWDP